ncbi:GNAT family N-acetyltransferase [Paenibacillus wenxiniae]|uniref:GNAT family N-acetyltransferase n=1 Tax=Paenibacillus wenxiniae TaxID=1636843 RepID=A0ABW4RIK3_9BACL
MSDDATSTGFPHYELQPASFSDAAWIAELRALVLKEDLTRLHRYDEKRVRERFLNSFQPDYTKLIMVDQSPVGCIALRPEQQGGYVLEHFYIHPHHQGKGIGNAVLNEVLWDSKLYGHTVTLNVLQGSPARRLYERHGFEQSEQDEIDVFMKRSIEA